MFAERVTAVLVQHSEVAAWIATVAALSVAVAASGRVREWI
jgi:hypothetical protein